MIQKGRESFLASRWTDAYAELSEENAEASPLGPEDVQRLAVAAHMLGQESESLVFWTRAHQGFLERGEIDRAARCAFWLSFGYLIQGEVTPSSGWLAKGRRLLSEAELDCAERGYLLLPAALLDDWKGLFSQAHAAYDDAEAIGHRFRDNELIAFARLGRGETLIHLGAIDDGVALLDEVMAMAVAGELSPVVTGLIYCAVIEKCHEISDVRRAREWTEVLSRWCASQPELVPYRGQCRVHRAEILQLQGQWRDALDEAKRACDRLPNPGSRPWAGAAYYQQGEVHRLRGELTAAEEAYRRAGQWGLQPQPGLALLRLAQGRTETAVRSISRTLTEAGDPVARSRILPAHVEIMLAARNLAAARSSADELAGLATGRKETLLPAAAAQALGSVLLAEGKAREALPALRDACTLWLGLDAPYEAARARVLIAGACRALGDDDGAGFEEEAASLVFQQLGARHDLEGIGRDASVDHGIELSPRELQVLRLLSTGMTNPEIASELVISEFTARRHVQNIFAKLGVSSRVAATKFALEHHLV
jgi:DNA-binding CsgD family transcriptional regulator